MKKTWGITLAVAMTATSLAGCAGGDKQGASQGTGEGEKGPTKFSISFSTTGNAHLESSADINKDKWVLKLEELTNTDMNIIPVSHKEFDQKMSLMFAGNDIPDVVGNLRGGPTTSSMAGSVEAGVFQPLDDLLKEHAPNLMEQVPEEAWEETRFEGQIYGIPLWISNPSRRGTYLRTDLLEQTGLPMPKTADEFLDVLRAFKEIGVEHPYQFRENFKYADTFLGAYDVLPFQFEFVDGKVQPKFFDVENMTKALEAYKTMYDEGLIPKDFATVTQTDYSRNISAGKAGMWAANAEGLPGFRTNLRSVVPDGRVDLVPSPTGTDGKGGLHHVGAISQTYYINSKLDEETTIGIIKFFDWMTTEEAEMFFSFGIEGDTYTIEDGKVNYKLPVTKEEVDEEGFRSGNLWMVHDGTYRKKMAELTEDGKDMISAFDTILANEGRPGIIFNPELESFKKYPDLAHGGDTGSKLILDHMIKMIYGREPISDWPKVIEEFLAKGGEEIIQEATERYLNNDGVIDRTQQ